MGTQNVKRDRSQDDLTCDGHLVHKLHNDPAGQELAGEVEQVAVVEHDQELGQLPLVGLDGPGVALACVHSAELCVHVNVHLMSAALGTVARVWAGAGLGGAGTTEAESHWNSC